MDGKSLRQCVRGIDTISVCWNQYSLLELSISVSRGLMDLRFTPLLQLLVLPVARDSLVSMRLQCSNILETSAFCVWVSAPYTENSLCVYVLFMDQFEKYIEENWSN